jgi:uncharacterized protein YndB with AHSA1/START domain
MKTLNFKTFINAPREKVYKVMLEDETYRKWTEVFCPGSYYKGDWSEGSRIIFLGPDPKTGEEGGMVAKIAKNTPNEYVSIEHLGEIKNGVEDLWPEGKGGFENYTFIEKDGGTEVEVEHANLPDEYAAMFNDMWPKALTALKDLAEN